MRMFARVLFGFAVGIVLGLWILSCGGGSSPSSNNPTQTTSSQVTTGVFTHHNDTMRQGANLSETTLTPTNVNKDRFGKKFAYDLDGEVYAQPLYVRGLDITGKGQHNVIIVATEHDSVYALDADQQMDPLWKTSFINPAQGVTPVSTADIGTDCCISPEVGITGTPVIDPATLSLYVVAETKQNGVFFQHLHVLDLHTGLDKPGSPVTIQPSVQGTGFGNDGMGNVPFNPLRQNQRPGLLLTNGVVYVAWASHQDIEPYHGWVAAFDATTFQQTGAFNVTPDQEGGGIWHSGGGPSVDATGNIFVAPGDGIFTADNGGRDYGNSYLKLSPRNLQLLDSFTPFNEKALDAVDLDTGSGGAMLVDQVGAARPHLMVTATKEQKIYLIDRDNMGRFDPTRDNIVQSIPNAFSGVVRSNPAYWNGNVYWAVDSSPLMMFSFQNGLLNPTPVSKSSVTYFFPGSTPSISANGTTNAIVWTIRNANGPAVLHAFDATDVSRELYNSTQAGGRDSVGTTVRFSVPTIVDGKVFVPTRSSVVVFGLL